jgi:gluconolactonase
MAPIVHELATGLRFPEGPIAMPDGSIVLVEIERRCVSRVTPDGAVTSIARTGGGPNGAAIGPDGKCYVCNNGGLAWLESPRHGLRPGGPANDYSGGRIERVDLATGTVERLYDASDKHRLNSPNDLVFDRHGGFWFTDMGLIRPGDLTWGRVCYAKADGSAIREVIFPLLTPNGIGLSPNEDRLYVAEMLSGRIWMFDIVAPGEIKKWPWPQSPHGGLLLASMRDYYNLDSMAVDSAGNVCVATLMNGGIAVISPDGQTCEHIPTPDPMTTNICFGGYDLKTAYITLGSSGTLVSMQWQCPGLGLNFLND